MTNEIRELNIDELDTVSGGGIISTAVNVVSATAQLVGGVVSAYLNGVAEYGHHLA
jgi:bacteriocin-like protein